MVLDSPLVNRARKETTCDGGCNDNEYSWAFSVRSQGERIVNAERRDEQGRAQAYIGRVLPCYESFVPGTPIYKLIPI